MFDFIEVFIHIDALIKGSGYIGGRVTVVSVASKELGFLLRLDNLVQRCEPVVIPVF